MVVFNNIKKCQASETFLNIYQNVIYVSIRKQNDVMGVTVKRNSKIHLHFILYILLFLTNVAIYLFNLISTALFSIIFIVLTLLMYVKSGCIIEETLIIIEPLGYQLITKYFIGQKSKFIPYEKVQNVFINEVIFKQKIIYLLTILTRESSGDELIPLFGGCKPRLNCLEFIYKALFQNNSKNYHYPNLFHAFIQEFFTCLKHKYSNNHYKCNYVKKKYLCCEFVIEVFC